METTNDYILGNRVLLTQPKYGYKAGLDAVLLASIIKIKKNQKIIDMGCGVGAISLCMAFHAFENDIPCEIHGLEIQEDLANLMQENIKQNPFGKNIKVINDNLKNIPTNDIPYNYYDHVVCNPPYMDATKGLKPQNTSRAIAHAESSDITLETWIKTAFKIVKNRGTISFIHTADRADEIIHLCHKTGGETTIYPIFSHKTPNKSAKRVIIQSRRGVKGGSRLMPGLIIHDSHNDYTTQAQNILFNAHTIEF